jgi:TonB-linked SusC/RagA family outer membrane protein
MRKLSMFLVALSITLGAIGQTKILTGRVTDEQGKGLPSASVKVVGSKTGTAASDDGMFKLQVSANETIEVSSVGYVTARLKVPSSGELLVRLMKDESQTLNEVVVSGAYNIKRSARGVSYNAQVINQEQLNVIRQGNLNNAIAGKVAGAQVRSQSAAALGRNTSIRLRGDGGLGGGDGVIYVVDGTILPNADDINLDDIEDLTVLQGPAAAAQFGPQGSGGAIVISLKKAKKTTSGFGVDVNIGAQIDRVAILPDYQNSYAGGGNSELVKYSWKEGQPVAWKELDGKYYHDYSDDASWGPRMVGQEYIPWYAWYSGHDRSNKTAKLTPQPNNARDFFQTGLFLNNSVAVSKVTDKINLRVSLGNIDVKGLLPTSTLKKNTFNLNTTVEVTNKLQFGANINYINQVQTGEIDDGYSNQSTGSFSQWFHRDLDMNIMKELQGLKTSDGVYASWNHNNPTSYDPANPRGMLAGNYWYNFYSYYNLVGIISQRDRLFGDLSLTYKFNNDLRFKLTYRKQQNTTWGETRYYSDLAISGLQTSGNSPETKGYYGTSTSYSNRRNIEFVTTYSKKVKEFQFNANAGFDFFRALAKGNGASTADGLNVPNLFTTANSKSQASISNTRSDEKYNAVFARGDIGYKNFLFTDFSLRNDWFSTLPKTANQVLSKSVGASFVFSDIVKIPGVSFGKVRASWGEIPQALGTSSTSFGAYRYPGFNYGVGQYQWSGNFLMSTPDGLVDSAIRGAVKTQKEIGIELRFFNGKAGIQATYWDGTEKDFPYSVSINGASGFTSKLLNTGQITKTGIDIQAFVKPIWTKNVQWQINATFGRLLKNRVDTIAPGISRISIEGVYGTTPPYVVHQTGQDWGQMYGNGIKRINGVPVLTEDGFYVNDPNVYFGSVLPKFTGGVQNSITFLEHFTANINIDYQMGGKFFSLSEMWGSYSGVTARTATLNDKGVPIRTAVADGGGVKMTGVTADGKPLTKYVEAQAYFQNLYGNKTFDPYVYDLTFVKLREVSLGYNVPANKLAKISKNISRVNFSLVARNPILLYAETKSFDPSEISNISGEAGQLPATRSFGFNLKIGF